MSAPRNTALIFDLGNVLAFFDYGRACDRIAQGRGLNGADLLERARSSGLAELGRSFELGEIDDDAFARGFRERVGLDVALPEFAAAWGDIFRLNEPVACLALHLADRGHPLVLGSNTNAIHARQFRRQFAPLLARFHHLVLSFEIGSLKPSARFFEACVAASERPANGCIFIDDVPEYVAGARQAGLRGVVYREPDQLATDLMVLGVELAGELGPNS